MLKLLRHPATLWISLTLLVADVVYVTFFVWPPSSRAAEALGFWRGGIRVTPASTQLAFIISQSDTEMHPVDLSSAEMVRKFWVEQGEGIRLHAIRFPGFVAYGTWAPVRYRESIGVIPVAGDPPIGEDTIAFVGETAHRVMLHRYRTIFDPTVATPEWFTERARRTWDPERGFRITATKLDPVGVLHNLGAFAVLLLCLTSLVVRRFVSPR
ncbi:MAG: hypothetical protein AAGD00_07885 [Planctomycetota bacterium]